MRLDGSNTNGFSQMSNGSARKPVSRSLTRDAQLNGAAKNPSPPSYFGHDREEVTRILIQSLYDLGYGGAADSLSKESGYQLETEGVAVFRQAVLGGRWSEAEYILLQSFYPGPGKNPKEKLVLAENANKNEMLFYLRQQKFLELLEARDLGAALLVLRTELTPLNYDMSRLHALSRYLPIPRGGDLSNSVVFSCVLPSTFTTKLGGMGRSARLESGYYPNYPVSPAICTRALLTITRIHLAVRHDPRPSSGYITRPL